MGHYLLQQLRWSYIRINCQVEKSRFSLYSIHHLALDEGGSNTTFLLATTKSSYLTRITNPTLSQQTSNPPSNNHHPSHNFLHPLES
ncbi:hypothetical protein Hanom_Chr03g00263861 [Helianthus anomalus]